MEETILPSASLLLGIIPALLLMYISLKGYEGLFKDKNIFLSFIAGIIGGMIAVVIESITMNVGVYFILLFPLLEQLLKTMMLNIRRLQAKKETVIYGLSLGLGFGSIFTPFSLISSRLPSVTIISVAWIVIGSLGIILMHGATGVIVGYGVFTKTLLKHIVYAVVFYIPVTLFIFLTTLYQIEYFQIGIVVYGIIIYWYVTTHYLPKILPDHRRRERKKQRNII